MDGVKVDQDISHRLQQHTRLSNGVNEHAMMLLDALSATLRVLSGWLLASLSRCRALIVRDCKLGEVM